MRSWYGWCFLVALVTTSQAAGQETTAKSRIVSVNIFKNGLAVVKREVQIPQAGAYRLDASPEPVHGTFWIESSAKIEAAVKLRDVEVPLHAEGVFWIGIANSRVGSKRRQPTHALLAH